jgi:hypothetical protein
MIKPNTWHEGSLDLKLCWRFFKYKLVLDDIRNKLRRDKVLVKKMKERGQCLDGLQSSPQGTGSPQPAIQIQSAKYGIGQSKICTCCLCPQVKEDEYPVEDDSLTNPPTWMIPCSMEQVLKHINRLLSDIDGITIPLGEINGMIRLPLISPLTVTLIILLQFTRLNFLPVQVKIANILPNWQPSSSLLACSRFASSFKTFSNL